MTINQPAVADSATAARLIRAEAKLALVEKALTGWANARTPALRRSARLLLRRLTEVRPDA